MQVLYMKKGVKKRASLIWERCALAIKTATALWQSFTQKPKTFPYCDLFHAQSPDTAVFTPACGGRTDIPTSGASFSGEV